MILASYEGITLQIKPENLKEMFPEMTTHFDEFRSYKEYVLRKEAPTPNRRYHCVLGLSTELLEILLSTKRDETVKKLGDLLFYIVLTQEVFSFECEIYRVTFDSHSNSLPQKELIFIIEQFLSMVKREDIYGTPQELEELFNSMWFTFQKYVNSCGLTISDLILSNREKLDKQYKEGFTTQESEERNDE